MGKGVWSRVVQRNGKRVEEKNDPYNYIQYFIIQNNVAWHLLNNKILNLISEEISK